MNYSDKKTVGLLFIVSIVQFVLAIIIGEAVYSGYSVGQNYLSDLGNWNLAGNYAAIFNASIIFSGIISIVGAYFIQRIFKNRLFTSLGFMIGVGEVGVGLFAENTILPMHLVFAMIAMIFSGAAAIMSSKFVKSPLSVVSVILGSVSLLAFALFMLGTLVNSGFYLGLGLGGMERFITYPTSLWALGFGAYLIGDSGDTK
jgi:hypothetical membrane protein